MTILWLLLSLRSYNTHSLHTLDWQWVFRLEKHAPCFSSDWPLRNHTERAVRETRHFLFDHQTTKKKSENETNKNYIFWTRTTYEINREREKKSKESNERRISRCREILVKRKEWKREKRDDKSNRPTLWPDEWRMNVNQADCISSRSAGRERFSARPSQIQSMAARMNGSLKKFTSATGDNSNEKGNQKENYLANKWKKLVSLSIDMSKNHNKKSNRESNQKKKKSKGKKE